MKLHSFTIPMDVDQGKLLNYVKRMLPELPEYVVREAFEKRDVKVNGQRVNRDATILAGAEVKLYTRAISAKTLIQVVYEDENVLVVVKPVGVSCELDAKGGKPITALAHDALLFKDATAKEPLLCHRLDNPTDGLLLLAKTPKVQDELQLAFRQRQVHKEYTSLVRGTPANNHELLHAFLLKDAGHACVRILPTERRGALTIITEYTVAEAGECARLHIALHTGRTHQIRAHMAYIGHPLLGDDKYGDYEFNKRFQAKRLMLSATSLSFALEGSMSYLNEKNFTYRPEF